MSNSPKIGRCRNDAIESNGTGVRRPFRRAAPSDEHAKNCDDDRRLPGSSHDPDQLRRKGEYPNYYTLTCLRRRIRLLQKTSMLAWQSVNSARPPT